MNNKAIFFGVDYLNSTDIYTQEKTCVNNIFEMKDFLEKNFHFKNTEVFTEYNNDREIYGRFLIEKLSSIISKSRIQKWGTLWIHFCGRACTYNQMEGCFLPKDYETFGAISQETFKLLFQTLFIDTKLICVFDCCQTKQFNDFKFQYVFEPSKMTINKHYKFDNILSKKNIIIIANQDNNIEDCNWCSCVMTRYFVLIYNQNVNFSLMDVLLRLQRLLRMNNYSCIPTITSSILITNTDKLLSNNKNI